MIPMGWLFVNIITLTICACFETWIFLGMLGNADYFINGKKTWLFLSMVQNTTLPKIWMAYRMKIHIITGYVFLPLSWIASAMMFTLWCREATAQWRWRIACPMEGVSSVRRFLQAYWWVTSFLALVTFIVVGNNLLVDMSGCTSLPCYSSNRTGLGTTCDPCTIEHNGIQPLCPEGWGYSHDVAHCHTHPTKEYPVMCGYRYCHLLDDCPSISAEVEEQSKSFLGFPVPIENNENDESQNEQKTYCNGHDSINIFIVGLIRFSWQCWNLKVTSDVLSGTFHTGLPIQTLRHCGSNIKEKKKELTTTASLPYPYIGMIIFCAIAPNAIYILNSIL